MRAPPALRLLPLLLLLLAGCGGEARPPDVVLFVIDTLRADHVGSYGYARDTTPVLDALAGEGILFERAYAPAPWTLPSVVSLMTGTFPCEHRVVVDGLRVAPTLVPLAERLRSRGYATASFYANAYAGAMSGLDRGFALSEARDETDGARVRRWLEGVPPEQPAFLYVHDIEPHTPYKAPPSYADRFAPVDVLQRDRVNRLLERFQRLGRLDWSEGRAPGTRPRTDEQEETLAALAPLRDDVVALYDGDVLLADERLGSVLDALREAGRLEDAVVIVTSDHGEEFGEHGYWQHDQSLYEELVHVPLVVRLPGGRGAGRRVREPVSLVDLLPTLADVLGDPTLARETRGRSLLPAMEGAGGEAAPRVLAQRIDEKKFYAPHVEGRGRRNLAVVDGNWKAVWNREPDTVELYDLSADALEQVDRSADEAERARALLRAGRGFADACEVTEPARGGALDEATRERLRALGYAE